jgi:hypothetical protein
MEFIGEIEQAIEDNDMRVFAAAVDELKLCFLIRRRYKIREVGQYLKQKYHFIKDVECVGKKEGDPLLPGVIVEFNDRATMWFVGTHFEFKDSKAINSDHYQDINEWIRKGSR